MRIEKDAICIDVEKCTELASYILSAEIPSDREESTLPSLDRKLIGNFYLFLVSICHQTSPLNKLPLKGVIDGEELKGWDFLFRKLEFEASHNPQILSADSWSTFTSEMLHNLYYDNQYGNRLSDIHGRVLLINNLGRVMKSQGWRWLEDVYDICDKRVATGTPNLIGLLAEFEAFRDPVKKKTFFLLSLMRNSGLWEYPDDKKLGPPVDYHEVRGHLRIGTVKILDKYLSNKLLHQIPVSRHEDILIRQAVVDAIIEISNQTGKTPSQLHYLFWNIFRSCCTRESPHCFKCPKVPHLPERYQYLTKHPGGNHCAFTSFCASASLLNKYIEHVFETEYY